MLYKRVLLGVAFLTACFCLANGQEFNGDTSVRDRRSFDVGLLLRNLLLNSATLSNLKANVTRTIATATQPPPPATRRPRPTRPSATQPPTMPPPPPPPPLSLNPFFNLFASSSAWKLPPTTTTRTTTTTPAPPPPPPRRPRPHSRPPFGNDYDYYYPGASSGLDGFVQRGGLRAYPSEYDFPDASASPSGPPARPSSARKSARNRQRPAPAALELPPASPESQRDRVLYQYAQRDDTSFNDNNDDAAEPSQSEPEADTQQQDEADSEGQDDPDATNGGEEGGDGAADAVDNDIPSFEEGAPLSKGLSPRFPSHARHPHAKPKSVPSFDSQSYYDSHSPSAHRFSSFGDEAASGGSEFGGNSFGFGRASPAKGSYQFRDSFSDFQTTYDGSHFQPSAFGSYKY